MDVSQMAQSGRGRNKRAWTKSEEECLINRLLELSANPSLKNYGNFKSGFKNNLEEIMNEIFPCCGLKAVPHIESKIKWFKDKCHVINDMLHTSGFSWDNEKNMIQHKNAQELWNVTFPFYDQLTIIYGVDRAIGVQLETFVEAVDSQKKEIVDLDNVESDNDDDEAEDNESKRRKQQRDKEGRGRCLSYMNEMNMHMSTIASVFATNTTA
ncbi:UDP-3-O-acyl-N-acetylglucosamine deacetylase [Bienertia sinuspersici]